jgi:hypothetical protein
LHLLSYLIVITSCHICITNRKHWPKEKINKAKCAKDGEDETVT